MNKKPGLEPGFLLDELLVRSVPKADSCARTRSLTEEMKS